jgi:hypothetical protein
MDPNEGQSLELIFESVVVVSWADLMRNVQADLIQIEYGFAADGTIECLKLWASINRGHWLLAVEYWASRSDPRDPGVHFENGYESDALKQVLQTVMPHQSEFVLPVDLGRQGLLQIPIPTQQESAVSSSLINETLRHVESLAELMSA